MPTRLLVSKSDAADWLGVSVRTIERLVAAGRFSQVQIERLARFRVGDLESYVRSLTIAGTALQPRNRHGVNRICSTGSVVCRAVGPAGEEVQFLRGRRSGSAGVNERP